jgi:hypothetical protein
MRLSHSWPWHGRTEIWQTKQEREAAVGSGQGGDEKVALQSDGHD